jgi:hypothetical protein
MATTLFQSQKLSFRTGFQSIAPTLRLGRPIFYRGDIAAILCGQEAFIADRLSQRDLRVVRAMAQAAMEAPQIDDDQLLVYAGYLLLQDELLEEHSNESDEALAHLTVLPPDFIRHRRRMPQLAGRHVTHRTAGTEGA